VPRIGLWGCLLGQIFLLTENFWDFGGCLGTHSPQLGFAPAYAVQFDLMAFCDFIEVARVAFGAVARIWVYGLWWLELEWLPLAVVGNWSILRDSSRVHSEFDWRG
jgi:hypothetical protein